MVVSLTTTPSMCAKFLRPHNTEKHGWLYQLSERGFEGILSFYRVTLGWVLRHPIFMLNVTVATACLSVYLYIIVPKGFFPQQDTGRLQGNIQTAPDMGFALTSVKLKQFLDIVSTDPAIDHISGSSGGGRGGGG